MASFPGLVGALSTLGVIEESQAYSFTFWIDTGCHFEEGSEPKGEPADNQLGSKDLTALFKRV